MLSISSPHLDYKEPQGPFVDTAILPVQFANLNFMSLVLPTLDYCSSLWDPAYMVHISKLEAVQKLAAKIVTKKWNCDYESLLSNLHRPRLSLRRTKQKMALCFRILKGYSIIPPSIFAPHPTPHLRHNHSLPLYYPVCNSRSHLSSFAVSSVPVWNCLPNDVVEVQS